MKEPRCPRDSGIFAFFGGKLAPVCIDFPREVMNMAKKPESIRLTAAAGGEALETALDPAAQTALARVLYGELYRGKARLTEWDPGAGESPGEGPVFVLEGGAWREISAETGETQ